MKNLITLISILVFTFSNSMAGVSIDWLRTSTASGIWIDRDTSNNSYALGSGDGLIHMTKRDRFGNFQWEITRASSNLSNGQNAVRVFVDPQGNPVIVGYQYSSLEEGPFAVALVVIKYDPSGNFLYETDVNGTFTFFNNSANRTKVTAQMDGSGNVYIGSGGNINGTSGFVAVKVSSAGIVLWTKVQSFNNNSSFFYVSNIRLKDKFLGLEGHTLYANANASTWVLDTDGNSKWIAVAAGDGGQDIAFDNTHKAYVITDIYNAVGPNTTNDFGIYKYDKNGVLIFVKAYDFQGGEIPTQIEFTPDQNLIVIGDGNQSVGGISFYVDWITAKFNLKGTLKWMKRYDKTSNNDEFPSRMVVDSSNNIFITGLGGPFPGGSNLGAEQMVTVKYKPNGTLEWTALIDTISDGNKGVSLVTGTDHSLFVIGSVSSITVHYLDNTGNASCSVPVNIAVTNITQDGSTITWDTVDNAIVYHVRYKTSTTSQWTQISTDQTQYTITGLFPGTNYDVQVEAVCNSGPTGFSANQQFVTLGTGYCASKGQSATKEWIDIVLLNGISSQSESDNGYADYTYLSADLALGSSNDITLSAGMAGGTFTEGWDVWIDYNHDGDFDDAGEKVVSYKSSQIGWETHNIGIPVTATLGPTRMRVSMKYQTFATPCEIFSRGEVEDYTVNIVGRKNAESTIGNSTGNHKLFVYPNPATSSITANLIDYKGTVNINISDMVGHIVHSAVVPGSKAFTLEVQQWNKGMYIFSITDETGTTRNVKWMKN
ncbi:MAG: fibronectin type III domain-containing protein [Chitinophagales bacterium]|nr:fibronectin type III domain-containing protein [Chitinophagales bacterium]